MLTFTVILVVSTFLNGAFLLAHYWLIARAMQQQHDQVLAEMRGFFNSPGENQPSQFALLVTTIIDQLSSSVVLRMKTTLMGVESVATRKAQQVVESVMADTNPVAGALLSAFPSLGKVLSKNPGALASLSSLKLPGFDSGNGGSGPVAVSYNRNKYK